MTDEELTKQLTETIKNKTLRGEVHVVQYLIPITKQYAIEYTERVIQEALKKSHENN